MARFLFLIGVLFPWTCCAQVVISEVMWAGSPLSSADEWLEIINVSSTEISLNGWSITKRASDGSDSTMIAFQEDHSIQPGEYLLISNYDASQSVLSTSPDVITTDVSLANSKLFLQLLDGSGSVIDQVDDGTGEPFAGGKEPYASMERIDLFASGSDESNWRSAVASVGFDEGVEVFGSPGEEGTKVAEVDEGAEVETSAPSETSDTSSTSIRITEVLINPKGSNDYSWIELGNWGEDAIDITGWIISDGSRSYVIEPRSSDGFVLEPGQHISFFHHQTHITLGRSDIITLSDHHQEIDRLALSSTGEEVSIGRTEDGSRKLYCVPSPNAVNHNRHLDPFIEVQSGKATDYTKVTLNLKAEVPEGSLHDAECFWDFDDDTASETCNPPSHSWDMIGAYNIELRVRTPCGEEVVRMKDVVVLEKKSTRSPKFMKVEQKAPRLTKVQRPISVPSSASSTSVTSVRSKNSQESALSTIPTSTIEQKMYSSKSSYSSSQNPVNFLPVKHRNVRSTIETIPSQHGEKFEDHIQEISLQKAKYQHQYSMKSIRESPRNSSEQSFAWILLFSQSALWLFFALKRMI